MTAKGKLGIVGVFLAITAVLAVYLFYTRSDVSAQLLSADDAKVVRRGAEVYREHCAACHGAALEGQPDWRKRGLDNRLPAPPHDASGHTWHHRDELLIKITRQGPASVAGSTYESNMPAYADVLSDADIRAVLSYIKSTWPPEVRRRHDERNARMRHR